MNYLNKKVKIVWDDALIYGPDGVDPNRHRMEMIGTVGKETSEFFVIKNPKNKRLCDGKTYPKQRPTFYYIPKGMVRSIKEIK